MNTLNLRFVFTMLIALVLTIIPLPDVLAVFRPPWVFMFVLYVQFYLPRYFSVSWVFLLGLSLDVLLATVMGEHAFALTLTSCLAASKTRRFHFFSVVQQMMLIALFCAVYQVVLVFIDLCFGYQNGVVYAAGTVLMSMIFWPWVKLLADNTFVRNVG